MSTSIQTEKMRRVYSQTQLTWTFQLNPIGQFHLSKGADEAVIEWPKISFKSFIG